MPPVKRRDHALKFYVDVEELTLLNKARNNSGLTLRNLLILGSKTALRAKGAEDLKPLPTLNPGFDTESKPLTVTLTMTAMAERVNIKAYALSAMCASASRDDLCWERFLGYLATRDPEGRFWWYDGHFWQEDRNSEAVGLKALKLQLGQYSRDPYNA